MPNVTTHTDARLAALTRWIEIELGLHGARVAPASEDASFRRYFRIQHAGRSLIAMDAPPEREDLGPYLAVAALLEQIGVHVPHVYEVDRAQGFVLLSDLGARLYLSALTAGADPEPLYRDAAATLLTMQSWSGAGLGALPAYDAQLLDREVQLFPDWFLTRHLEAAPDGEQRATVARVSNALADAALEQPQVFVHRDYHSRNLMLCAERNPGVLDFQDAVRGAVTYDLVSIYKDCYIAWPRPRVLEWLERYRSAALVRGLRLPAAGEFVRWFDLMGVQRHLKVLGIFARLWYRDGKPGYLADLPRVLAYVQELSGQYGELQELDRLLAQVVAPRFAAAQARVGL
jgi:aminoglycoside/choline kinase family phosphotransferase